MEVQEKRNLSMEKMTWTSNENVENIFNYINENKKGSTTLLVTTKITVKKYQNLKSI